MNGFVAAATITGAIPVPSASIAVAAETVLMINTIAATMGVPISPASVASSLGGAAAVNMVGRQLFIEGARFLADVTGGWALPVVCAWGATTAALQMWILGQLTIAICENGGVELAAEAARRVVEAAMRSFRG